jgi:exopolyphosphatase / guanosine-5'-triphosphate,3'-diphosphate pyrophosphatase
MRVGVIDVGSNTARLLVATVRDDGTVTPVAQERTYLRLGAEIERAGTLGKKKIRACAETCGGYARRVRELDVDVATVIVTAPGRQSDSSVALTTALAETTGLPVRVLTSETEGRLAYDGAIARAESPLPGVVAVVDIGGGSTELVVGIPRLGTAWVRSADLGSLRLTRAHLNGRPPAAREIDAARAAVRRAFAGITAPPADLGLAVGGSARAIAKIVGRRLDAETLGEAIRLLARRPSGKALRSLGISAERAETVLAGALLLEGVCRVLGISLTLGRGGLREGAALELAARAAARAA